MYLNAAYSFSKASSHFLVQFTLCGSNDFVRLVTGEMNRAHVSFPLFSTGNDLMASILSLTDGTLLLLATHCSCTCKYTLTLQSDTLKVSLTNQPPTVSFFIVPFSFLLASLLLSAAHPRIVSFLLSSFLLFGFLHPSFQ